MTESALSVIDDVEPPKHDQDYLEKLIEHRDAARRDLATRRVVDLYDSTEIPGVTKGSLPKLTGASPATLYDHVTCDVQPAHRPVRGRTLDAAIVALQHQLSVLEAEIAEQEALAKAHDEWTKRQSTDMHLAIAVPNGSSDEVVAGLRVLVDEFVREVHAALGQAVSDESQGGDPAAEAA